MQFGNCAATVKVRYSHNPEQETIIDGLLEKQVFLMGEVIVLPVQSELAYLPVAAGAESFVVGLQAMPEIHSAPHEETLCFNADNLIGIGSIRIQARQEAERIFEYNRQNLRAGNFDAVPLDVDALGTAAKLDQVRKAEGHESPLYIEVRQGLVKDCSRKWAEAFRKNGPEYFEDNVQTLNNTVDKLYADGLPVDDMIQNGLSPVAEAEEADRRINDYVRLITNKALVKLPQSGELATIHVSTCAQWAINSYQSNPNGAHGGYAPEIKKLMINYDWFDPEAGEVHHEQLGVPGIYITEEVINEGYQAMGLTSGEHLNKTEIHNTVGIVTKSELSGVLKFAQILDEIAGTKSGKNIFLGEEVSADHPKNYESIITEAAQRRKQQAELSEQLACYVENLYAKGEDPALATVRVEAFIQKTLLDITAKDPDQAEMIFNKATADGFRQVQSLRAAGRYYEAQKLQTSVELAAPPASSCGAGSCGLESVDPFSVEGRDLKDKLHAKDGDTIVKDKERGCVKCRKKTVTYAYNINMVNKYCSNCEAFESKESKVA